MKWVLALALILSVSGVSAAYFEQVFPNSFVGLINGTAQGAVEYRYISPIQLQSNGNILQTLDGRFGFQNHTIPSDCVNTTSNSVNLIIRNSRVSIFPNLQWEILYGCRNFSSNSITTIYFNAVTTGTNVTDNSSISASPQGLNNFMVDGNYNTGVYCSRSFGSPCFSYNLQNLPGTEGYNVTVFDARLFFYYENNLTVNVFDEKTALPINNATVILYDETGSTTINTFTGNATFVDVGAGRKTIVINSTGYNTREYVNFLQPGSYSSSVNYYLLDNSSGTFIRFTVLSQSYNTLPGAIINAQRKSLDGTTYYEVQDCVADSNGECLLYLETFDATYRFVTEYEGIVRTGLDTVLSRDTYTIIMNIEESTLNPVLALPGISSGITYTPPNTFTYTVIDPSGNTVNGSLKVYWRYGGNLILANSSVGSGSSFTAAATVSDMSLGEEVVAEGYIFYNGQNILTDVTSVKTNPQGTALAGGTLLLFIGLAFTVVFIFAFDPVAPIAIFGVLLLVGFFTGLINLGIGAIVSVIIVIAIGIYRMRSV